jgi:gluconolactonase
MSATAPRHRLGSASVGILLALLLLLPPANPAAAAEQRVEGLATPESVVIGPDGRIYVSEIGEFGKDGDGRIAAIGAQNKPEPFASGMDDPKGLAASKDAIFAADKTRIWKIDMEGKASVFVPAEAFPQPPLFLNDLAFDSSGNLFASDSGDLEKGGKGAIFKITPQGTVSLVVSESQNRAVKSPNGLLADGPDRFLVVDFATGELLRLDLSKGSTEKIADGFGGGDGLARDAAGMLYITDWKNGKAWKLDLAKPGAKPEAYAQKFQASADITLSSDGAFILVPDMKAGALIWLPK